ncbi:MULTISPECIES: hypothetical protein [unclassified Rhizobium]|uniref:hypothetical protein n=1 Tax=unclassified Rhizobium TaxID=2613769 RepID=UPI001051F81D|nr:MULTISPECIES: hypothetical protein [unclassified Rhizobium]MBB3393771.1 hypothetical protein [Rhizobium sp. BK060]MBB4166495.1 hypothetical protein [Rhizobium sp. BK538]TCM81629.1 hypothetical protein EV291_101105 [Rhizobium sp. BK068]
MTNGESWNTARGDVVHHHATDDELDGMGEREYVEHVNAHKPSISERFIVLAAFALLGIAGLTVHLTAPMASGLDTATVGSISESLPAVDYCREHSPYPDRSC